MSQAVLRRLIHMPNMVSVPYNPSPSTPVDVFGDDVGQLAVYWWDSGPNDAGVMTVSLRRTAVIPQIYLSETNICQRRAWIFLWAPSEYHP